MKAGNCLDAILIRGLYTLTLKNLGKDGILKMPYPL